MAKYIPTKRGNPCPICANTSGKCREVGQNILCMTHPDQDSGSAGWKYIKPTKDGLWGIYVPDDGTTNGKSWQDVLSERLRFAQSEKEKELAKLNQSLPVGERSVENRKLLLQLDLHPDHRDNLRERGLTDSQIRAGLFGSVKPGQKVSDISPRLAGVGSDGRLKLAGRGFLVPVYDIHGRILGMQLRLDNTDDNQYRWLKWEHSSKLPNGEMPITVARPLKREAEGIGVIEGILKPDIASQLSGIVFIGAAGGNFSASQEQFKQALAHLDQELNTKTVRIFPDAGGVSNPHVYHRDCETIRLIQSWGYEVEVGDWGQFHDKSQLDYDELLAAGRGHEVRFIRAAEYLELREDESNSFPDGFFPIDEPDLAAYKEWIEWEQEQERVALAQEKESFLDWFKRKILGLGKKAKKGFGQEQKVKVTPPKVINYEPGMPLPSPSDYEGLQPPKIIYPPGQRLKVAIELKNNGWSTVADTSFMGLGKSHETARLEPDPDAANKIWYLDINHLNPSTEAVEQNYTDLRPRHDGLYRDGNGQLRRAITDDQKEVAVERSNCWQADPFNQLKQKGYSPEGQPRELSPICQKCPFNYLCGRESGNGYGFRHLRKRSLEARQIRAHIDSLPNPDDYSFSQDIAVVEEASLLLRGTKKLSAAWTDLLSQFDQIEASELRSKSFVRSHSSEVGNPDLGLRNREHPSSFIPLKNALRSLLTGEVEQGRYGLDDEAVRAILGSPPDNLPELIEQVEAALPCVEDVIVEPDSVSGCGGQWRSLGHFARSWFKKEARAETAERMRALPVNILPDLLKVWGGLKPGAMRVNFDSLSVTVIDPRHGDLLKNFKFRLLLDATLNKDYAAATLGIDQNSLIEIQQETPDLSNLLVFNTHIQGLGSRSRSDACKKRIAAYKARWREIDPDVKFLGMKGEEDIDGYWHHHNRGSNDFERASNFVCFGSPFPNVGFVQDHYFTLFGTKSGFERHYQELVAADIVQAVGRQRSHRYLDQQFTLDLVGTDQDLSFLTERYGIKVIERQSFEFCPEAGTPKQASRWKILLVAQQLKAAGQKVTAKAIAAATGLSERWVRELASDFQGGFAQFKKAELFLDKSSIGGVPVFESDQKPNEIHQAVLARQELRDWIGLNPVEVAASALQIIHDHGWGEFREFLRSKGADIQALYLGSIAPLFLPESWELLKE